MARQSTITTSRKEEDVINILLGVSGDVGSFSEEAALHYAKQKNMNASLVYLIDMEGVLTAIEGNEIELGILPVVNLQGGLVKPAFQAMGKHLFTPVDELWLHVQQCLLVLPGTKSHQITSIASHPQGIAQCEQYLQNKFNNFSHSFQARFTNKKAYNNDDII